MTVARTRRPGAGRPPRYKSPDEMAAKIDNYFLECAGEPVEDPETGKPMLDKYGKVVFMGRRPPTVTGLALALGFTTRHALIGYQAKGAYRDLIDRAKTRIEMYAEERLYDRDGCMGARFNLRNNFKGWDDERRDGADVEDLSPLAALLGVTVPEEGKKNNE